MSKKKTALMQLIEIIDEQFSFYVNQGDNDKALTFSWVKNEAENLLETEKQDLIEARKDGRTNHNGFNHTDDSKWFNEKYERDGE